jgi:hypothetical protein
MNLKRYSFEVIATNGCCKPVAERLSSDMMAVFNKVTEISEEIAQLGQLIRVKDQNGDAVFAGVMTLQGAEDQGNRAA